MAASPKYGALPSERLHCFDHDNRHKSQGSHHRNPLKLNSLTVSTSWLVRLLLVIGSYHNLSATISRPWPRSVVLAIRTQAEDVTSWLDSDTHGTNQSVEVRNFLSTLRSKILTLRVNFTEKFYGLAVFVNQVCKKFDSDSMTLFVVGMYPNLEGLDRILFEALRISDSCRAIGRQIRPFVSQILLRCQQRMSPTRVCEAVVIISAESKTRIPWNHFRSTARASRIRPLRVSQNYLLDDSGSPKEQASLRNVWEQRRHLSHLTRSGQQHWPPLLNTGTLNVMGQVNSFDKFVLDASTGPPTFESLDNACTTSSEDAFTGMAEIVVLTSTTCTVSNSSLNVPVIWISSFKETAVSFWTSFVSNYTLILCFNFMCSLSPFLMPVCFPLSDLVTLVTTATLWLSLDPLNVAAELETSEDSAVLRSTPEYSRANTRVPTLVLLGCAAWAVLWMVSNNNTFGESHVPL